MTVPASIARRQPPPAPQGSQDPSSSVNFTPHVQQNFSNVNPSLNERGLPNADQVLNVLDMPMQVPNALEQFAVADSGLLEGIPGSMFDWRESRFFRCDFQADDRFI